MRHTGLQLNFTGHSVPNRRCIRYWMRFRESDLQQKKGTDAHFRSIEEIQAANVEELLTLAGA